MIAASVVNCALTLGPIMARMDFSTMLVWNAILGRVHEGVVVATDALLADETRLSPSTVKDIRRALQASGLITCTATADGELTIVLPEKAAVP